MWYLKEHSSTYICHRCWIFLTYIFTERSEQWTQQFGFRAHLLPCMNSKEILENSKKTDFFLHGRCSSAWYPCQIWWCLDIWVALSKESIRVCEKTYYSRTVPGRFCLFCHELLRCPNKIKLCTDITHLSALVDKRIPVFSYSSNIFFILLFTRADEPEFRNEYSWYNSLQRQKSARVA